MSNKKDASSYIIEREFSGKYSIHEFVGLLIKKHLDDKKVEDKKKTDDVE